MPDDIPSPSTDLRPPSRLAPVFILGVVALIGAGLAYWAISAPDAHPKGRVLGIAPSSGVLPGDRYVGMAACAECHPGQHAAHSGSGHSRTLRAIAKTPLLTGLDGRTVADPERPGVSWSYRRDGDSLIVDRRINDVTTSYTIDYALGSGRNATTLVSVLDREPRTFRLLEHRLTHYREGDLLKITPGHGADAPADRALKPYGRTLTVEDSFRCLNCHATRTSLGGPDTPIVLEEMIPTVSCERCHGPGREHVAAARRGASAEELRMPSGDSRQTAAEQMSQCGQCHHHPDRSFPGEIDVRNPNLVRFQPVGLMQSKCYTKTPGNLSCSACHDPHTRPSTDTAKYETTCLSCHAEQQVAACKVSARSGCVGCHMPKTPTAQGIPFSDHWIRIFRDGAKPAEPGRFVPPGETLPPAGGAREPAENNPPR